MDDQIKFRQNPSIEVPKSTLSPSPPPKKDGRKELTSTIAVIILAPILAFLLTVFVFQSYEVDGPSMETTLSDNDRLIVNKTGKTFSRILSNDYIPDRYDIIVFTHEGDMGIGNEEKQLIKRVIGLPGDHVVVKDGKVTVFNPDNPEGFNVDSIGPEADVIRFTDGNVDQTVGAGEVFVLGDNRQNSRDSRSFGMVKSEDIVGSLSARIYPLDSIKKF